MSFYNDFCNLENVLTIQKIEQSEILLRKEDRKGGRKGGDECRLESKWRIEGLFQIPTPSCLRLSGSLQVL